MKKELLNEAEKLGLNARMYYLLPPETREALLRKDIKNRQKEVSDNGQTRKI